MSLLGPNKLFLVIRNCQVLYYFHHHAPCITRTLRKDEFVLNTHLFVYWMLNLPASNKTSFFETYDQAFAAKGWVAECSGKPDANASISSFYVQNELGRKDPKADDLQKFKEDYLAK